MLILNMYVTRSHYCTAYKMNLRLIVYENHSFKSAVPTDLTREASNFSARPLPSHVQCEQQVSAVKI